MRVRCVPPGRAGVAALLALPALLGAGLPSAAAAEDPRGADVEEESGIWDPWEPMNRAIFAFNETLDVWLLEPVATAWDWALPDFALEGLDNFFDNLETPALLVNDLLQAKPDKFGHDLGRFLVNTTFGLGGFFDPASASGLARGEEDFGQTLGVWGVPPGPYLVLPLFGPSSPRDAAGLGVDSAVLSPVTWFVPWYVSLGAGSLDVVNTRALLLEDIAAERRAAFDFYAAVRNASVTFRQNQVRDRAAAPEEEDEDLYYFEEDELYYLEEE